MLHALENARAPVSTVSTVVTVAPAPLSISPGPQASFTVPRLRSRSAPSPVLLHRTPHEAQREKKKSLPLVRGLGGCELTSAAVRALTAGKTVHLTLFWGFRALDPARPGLNAAEADTLRAHVAMAHALGEHCKPVLLLADSHAEHNGIPKKIWEPYYRVVAQHAADAGVRTVMLSSIMATLDITPAALAARGPALVLRPNDPATPGASVLTGVEWRRLKMQAEHLCKRFPEVFPAPKGEKAKRTLYDTKALAYVRLRAAEGRQLLPALKNCFGGEAVLPVHVSDPATERLGVHGLHIYTMDENQKPKVGIPWGESPATRPPAH